MDYKTSTVKMKCNTCGADGIKDAAELKKHFAKRHSGKKTAGKPQLGGVAASGGPPRPLTKSGKRPGQALALNSTASGGKVNVRGKQLRNMGALGSTEDGRSWALSCLHPMGEDVDTSRAIPDPNNMWTARPTFVSQDVFSAPTAAGGGVLTGTWDCVLVFPDVVEIAAVVFVKPSTETWNTVRTNVTSATPNATWRPNFVLYQPFTTGVAGALHRTCERWRVTSRGATTHLNASFTANQGMVYAANLPDDLASLFYPGPTTADPLYPPQYVAVHKYGTLDSVSIAQRARNYYSNNAREGCYCVMYPTNSTFAIPWQTRETSLSGAELDTFYNGRVLIPWPDQINGFVETGTYPFSKSTMGPDNMFSRGGFTTGFMLYEGLAPDASVVLKTRTAVEVCPSSNSGVLQCFVRQNPMLDMKALETVAKVSQTAAGAYPANYNDLGKLLGEIWGAVSGVAKPALSWAKGSGIPIVGDVASVLDSVLGALGI